MSENSSAGFSIDPDAVRTIAGNLGGILMQAITVSRDLERLVVAPAVYGQIGTAVASGSAALQDGQVSAMGSMMRVLSDISSEIGRIAATTKTMDADIATGLGSLHDSASSGSGSSLWGSATAALLARTAMGGGGHPATGGSVEDVLGYLGRTGMGQLAEHPVAHGQFRTPTALADWLDADPDNQTRLGLIGVYAGDTGNLADVPGGLHPGDRGLRRPLAAVRLGPDPVFTGLARRGRQRRPALQPRRDQHRRLVRGNRPSGLPTRAGRASNDAGLISSSICRTNERGDR